MLKAPVFVGGAGRSGTTLLRVILDSHPHIACGPELKLLPEVSRLWTMGIRAGEILGHYQVQPQDFSRMCRRLVEDLLKRHLRASGKQRIAEKTPNNVFHFYQLSHIFPDARFVHVVRDGRDAVCSLLSMNWVEKGTNKKLPYVEDPGEAARYWARAVQAGLQARETLGPDKVFQIRYEDIVHQPEQALRDLFRFIDEPWDPCVLDFHTRKRESAPRESSDGQVSQKLYTTAAGRWTRDLKPEDVSAVKQVIGELLIELGYATGDDW